MATPKEKRILKNCKSCGEVIQKSIHESWPRYLDRRYCSMKCTYAYLKETGKGWWAGRDI